MWNLLWAVQNLRSREERKRKKGVYLSRCSEVESHVLPSGTRRPDPVFQTQRPILIRLLKP